MEHSKLSSDRLVAHRGYQANYPENTQLSLRSAIQVGARHIELDVQFSSDKKPVIYHDIDLQRVSGMEGLINQFSRKKLLSLPAFEPERLGNKYQQETISPLEALTEILQENPNVMAFVELKEESIDHCGREHILASVSSILQSVAEQTVLMSFDYQLARMARDSHWPWVGLVLKSWEDLVRPDIGAIKADYIYIDHLLIPPDLDLTEIESLANTQLVAYEVADLDLAATLITQGVDMLETFDIAGLLK